MHFCQRHCSQFFFFQAEDGIRDVAVTGVQTCALPISWFGPRRSIVSVSVVLVGLGPIGVGMGRLLRARSDVALVGAADIDPQKAGWDLGEILEGPPLGVTVSGSVGAALAARPQVAVLATGSRLPAIAPQIYELIEGGCSVVSTSEELSYPSR